MPFWGYTKVHCRKELSAFPEEETLFMNSKYVKE